MNAKPRTAWSRVHGLPRSPWQLNDDTGALYYRPLGLRLPLRIGTFLLSNHDDNIAWYVQPYPFQRIGVTLLDRNAELGPEMSKLRRAATTPQALNHWLVHKLDMQVGAVHSRR